MRHRKVYFIILFCVGFGLSLWSQKPYPLETPEAEYQRAMELFYKQKYAPAQTLFLDFIEKYPDFNTELKVNASYYSALCSVYLFNDDAAYRINQFIATYPQSMKARDAVWTMARFLYQTKKYRKAIPYFERTDRNMLSKQEQAEYYFKKGYCYFISRKYDKASAAFFEIKDIQNDYSGPAVYYYGYIAYSSGNFETALTSFRRLKNDETFKEIVPYYILQILYKQKKYDEIIATGPALLESSIPSRSGEIARFIGDSYYQTGDYEKAKPYLEMFVEKTKNLDREGKYEIGFMYYKLQDYAKAIPYFEGVKGRKDPLAQNGYYLLADCFLKTGDKGKAGMAFQSAAGMDFDPEISEDALFNAAKISYELSFSPFNETIRNFEKFIELYPYSERVDEAYNFLVMAYLNAKNYRLALESIKKIQNKTPRIKEAYQRVAFYRGLELYSNFKYEEAIDMFDVAIQQGEFDRSLIARCFYWKGESNYRLRNFKEAVSNYKEFLLSPGSFSLDEYNLAHYNLAYCYFDMKQYAEASRWFRKYTGFKSGGNAKLLADAYNRLGDCAFVASDYPLSVTYYEKSIGLSQYQPDYALFQSSFAQGLQKKYGRKISGLTQLMQKYPSSSYLDNALFERGRSYVSLGKSDLALADFYAILEKFPGSVYYSKALLEIGLVYYNQNNNQEAIKAYKKVIDKFPNTSDSRSALAGLRTVYVDMNEVDAYFSYVRSLGSFANVSISEQDSLTYISAENIFMAGNCERAIKDMSNYLEKFPQGSFVLNAHFYRAECLFSSGEKQKSLDDYLFVIKHPANDFTEPALQAASSIYYENKAYADALESYNHLKMVATLPSNKQIAQLGQFRCLYELNDFPGVIKVGPAVLETAELSEEQAREIYYKLGKANYAMGEMDEALRNFRKVAIEIKTREGAESKYRVAEIYFNKGQTEKAAAAVKEFIDENTPHAYWMGKIFLLSADISIKSGDTFQARYTLQSLIDYYETEDDGIKEAARQKLEQLDKSEKPAQSDPSGTQKYSQLMRIVQDNICGFTSDYHIAVHFTNV